MPVRVLEAEAAFAEIDLAGDSRIHHPLQRAVDRGAADAAIFLADEIDEIVGAEMSFLPEERIDDEIAFAGAFAAGGAHAFDVDGMQLCPRHLPSALSPISGCARRRRLPRS